MVSLRVMNHLKQDVSVILREMAAADEEFTAVKDPEGRTARARIVGFDVHDGNGKLALRFEGYIYTYVPDDMPLEDVADLVWPNTE